MPRWCLPKEVCLTTFAVSLGRNEPEVPVAVVFAIVGYLRALRVRV